MLELGRVPAAMDLELPDAVVEKRRRATPSRGRIARPPASRPATQAASSAWRSAQPAYAPSRIAKQAAPPQATSSASRRSDGRTSSSRLPDPCDDGGEIGIGGALTGEEVTRELRILQAE
jgi:hypothetical protein